MDYGTLRLVWWALLGFLLTGFAVMDGFDLGTAALLPFVARNDSERRIVINTVGPVWEGNQVWFILGGGAIFAAWPALYAASFSGFYPAMLLVLATLILRPAGFKFRSKLASPLWRGAWDWALFSGGIVPALVFGIAFGNLFLGVPFGFDAVLRFQPDIDFLSLFNPFGLLAGVVSLAMLVLHGAAWINLKTEEAVQVRARAVMPFAALVFALAFVAAGFWVSGMPGYHITSAIAPDGPSNPLRKTVALVAGGWRDGAFGSLPYASAALALFGALCAVALRRWPLAAFLCSALTPIGTIATAGLTLFPFLLPSSSHPQASLTVWDASSSKLTLGIMLGAACLFMPIILAYTAFAYRVLRGPVRAADINSHNAY